MAEELLPCVHKTVINPTMIAITAEIFKINLQVPVNCSIYKYNRIFWIFGYQLFGGFLMFNGFILIFLLKK